MNNLLIELLRLISVGHNSLGVEELVPIQRN